MRFAITIAWSKTINRVTIDSQLIEFLDGIPSPIAVLEADAEGQPRFVGFNLAACEHAGFDRSVVTGKTAKEAFPGANGEALYRFHLSAFECGDRIQQEFSLMVDGVERRIRTILQPVVDEEGKVVRVFAVPEDVSSGRAILTAERDAVLMNREMESFISLAAHDLRSPMRKVHALAEMLRKDSPELNGESLKILDMLEGVASRSFEMITDLINHAQATDVASDDVTLESFSLHHVCEQVMTTLDPQGEHAWRADDTQMRGERVAIQIVIRNLIDNAIKHNLPKDGKKSGNRQDGSQLLIDISAAPVDAEFVDILVCDNGKGFSDAGKNQLEKGETSVASGFGLAGVRRLVVARGGDVSIDSVQDSGQKRAGATVRVRFPGVVVEEKLVNTAG